MALHPPAEPITAALLESLAHTLTQRAQAADTRYLLGIAGIGGAGKSTLAHRLYNRIDKQQPGIAAIVPLDGYHLPNTVLDQRNLRDRKGAPETFDVHGYIALLHALRTDTAKPIAYPIYDRHRHDPVWDPAHTIEPTVRLIITEGNYLLLDHQPWDALARLLDACWLLDTPIDQARHWILHRHHQGGRSPEDALAHYERNDLHNARHIHAHMRPPDRVLYWQMA